MSNLLTDTSKLSKAIAKWGKDQVSLNVILHSLACSAVALASRDGRCDWLNELYSVLSPIMQDSFRAWLSPNAWTFEDKTTDDQKPSKWLSWNKDKGFHVIPGTVTQRPTFNAKTGASDNLMPIEAVAADFQNKFMGARKAADTANQLAWNDAIIKQITGLMKKLEKETGNHKNEAVTAKLKAVSADFTKTATSIVAELTGLDKLEVVAKAA